MKQAKDLYNALKAVLGNSDSVFPAVVKSVDKSKNVCEVAFDDLEIGNVRLQSIVDDEVKGVICYPAVDSVVLVQCLGDKGEYFITMVSVVEEFKSSIGETVFKQSVNGFEIKNGDAALKEVLQLVIEAVMQVVVVIGNNPDYTKLNKALAKLNKILK